MPLTEADWDRAKAVVKNYAGARLVFRHAEKDAVIGLLLKGNDNKVGNIGEFWAKRFFVNQGYQLGVPGASNQEGYDFECSRSSSIRRVSVKVISSENKNGKQLPLKPSTEWTDLVLVELDDDLNVKRLGRATRTQYDNARNAKVLTSKQPVVSLTWLNDGGWMKRFGRVVKKLRL